MQNYQKDIFGTSFNMTDGDPTEHKISDEAMGAMQYVHHHLPSPPTKHSNALPFFTDGTCPQHGLL